jgi:hypothetical protein
LQTGNETPGFYPLPESISLHTLVRVDFRRREKGGRASGKIMQLYYEYTFWCLPAGVDPEVAAALNFQEIIF